MCTIDVHVCYFEQTGQRVILLKVNRMTTSQKCLPVIKLESKDCIHNINFVIIIIEHLYPYLIYSESVVVEEQTSSTPPTPDHSESSSLSVNQHQSAHVLKKKRQRESEFEDVVVNSLKSIEARREERRAREREQKDEEDLFGQQVAAILRRLPMRRRALTKINIQQMLFQAEFETTDLEESAELLHENMSPGNTTHLHNTYNF